VTRSPLFWSPDGARILFSSTLNGKQDVYSINADGSGLRRVTDNADEDYHGAWSGDGSRVAFISERDGEREVYVVNADGSSSARLTHDAKIDGELFWSPDSSALVFGVGAAGGGGPGRGGPGGIRGGDTPSAGEIYIMNANGSGRTRIAEQASGSLDVSWASR
jgi:Tol biopolymer transport system component